MAIEESILKSVKKTLGLDAAYDAFDQDVLMHMNTAFFVLYQLGVGPSSGFMVEDETKLWEDFDLEQTNRNAVKTYVYAKVRSLFDPPGTPHHLTALKEQIEELEYRLLVERNLNSRNLTIAGVRKNLSVRGGNLDD